MHSVIGNCEVDGSGPPNGSDRLGAYRVNKDDPARAVARRSPDRLWRPTCETTHGLRHLQARRAEPLFLAIRAMPGR